MLPDFQNHLNNGDASQDLWSWEYAFFEENEGPQV